MAHRFNLANMMVTQGRNETATLRLMLKEYYADESATGEDRVIYIQPIDDLDTSDEWLKQVLIQVIEQL